MEKTEPLLDISCHQTNLPGLRLGYIQSSCWPEGSHGNPQTIWSVDKTTGCSLQTDKVPLLKTTPKQLSKHGGVKLVPT